MYLTMRIRVVLPLSIVSDTQASILRYYCPPTMFRNMMEN